MTIKEVEEQTGIARSSLRFYEKEQLIRPARIDGSGYRDYTKEDVEHIKKIAYLRTLDISLENIRHVINHETPLREIIEKQAQALDSRIADLEKAKAICQEMLLSDGISYDNLDVEAFVPELTEYWNVNRRVFQKDSAGVLHLLGSLSAWAIITAVCLLAALLTYPSLPAEIPIQWNGGAVSSMAGKAAIFAYPAACILSRLLLRPLIWGWLRKYFVYSDNVADLITNFLCLAALSVEIFTIFSTGTV